MKQHFIQVQCYQTKNQAHAKAQQFVVQYDCCLIDDEKLAESIESMKNRIDEINIAFPRCQNIQLSINSFTDGRSSASIDGNFHMSIVEVKRFELSYLQSLKMKL